MGTRARAASRRRGQPPGQPGYGGQPAYPQGRPAGQQGSSPRRGYKPQGATPQPPGRYGPQGNRRRGSRSGYARRGPPGPGRRRASRRGKKHRADHRHRRRGARAAGADRRHRHRSSAGTTATSRRRPSARGCPRPRRTTLADPSAEPSEPPSTEPSDEPSASSSPEPDPTPSSGGGQPAGDAVDLGNGITLTPAQGWEVAKTGEGSGPAVQRRRALPRPGARAGDGHQPGPALHRVAQAGRRGRGGRQARRPEEGRPGVVGAERGQLRRAGHGVRRAGVQRRPGLHGRVGAGERRRDRAGDASTSPPAPTPSRLDEDFSAMVNSMLKTQVAG